MHLGPFSPPHIVIPEFIVNLPHVSDRSLRVSFTLESSNPLFMDILEKNVGSIVATAEGILLKMTMQDILDIKEGPTINRYKNDLIKGINKELEPALIRAISTLLKPDLIKSLDWKLKPEPHMIEALYFSEFKIQQHHKAVETADNN